MDPLHAVEICAGAGGQSLGLHLAGFEHDLAIELDGNAAKTLTVNLARRYDVTPDAIAGSVVRVGDVADPDVWRPTDHRDVDLLAGGVPCPPFSLAGHQRGATDERDLFAWAVECAARMRPRALLLENVRGLAGSRFSGYRQAIADRLDDLGYVSEWRLLHASDYGVPQLRPRFVLVALVPEYARHFAWPVAKPTTETVGTTLADLMAERGWRGAEKWVERADGIAPTIVGGSKRHGGADLGPSRAKAAWRALGVDGHGVADQAPDGRHAVGHLPRLTCEMVARLQGWHGPEYEWDFAGGKTSRYRQIGNAFPPPVARALGESLSRALAKQPVISDFAIAGSLAMHDVVYAMLSRSSHPLTAFELAQLVGELDPADVRGRIDALRADFVIEEILAGNDTAFWIADFKAFTGQADHHRHAAFGAVRAKIS